MGRLDTFCNDIVLIYYETSCAMSRHTCPYHSTHWMLQVGRAAFGQKVIIDRNTNFGLLAPNYYRPVILGSEFTCQGPSNTRLSLFGICACWGSFG